MVINKKVPNILTGANLAIGMLSIVYAIQDKYVLGAILILLAALLDRFDGKIARKIGASSEFGKELDSLADLVSFGVAPAIIIYLFKLDSLGIVGIVIMIIFALSGALRLARFNILNISGHFLGVPITIAGSLVAFMVLLGSGTNSFIDAFLVLLLSWMMLSSIKIPKI
ncbi:MAG: CDP-diacylglycerol--serine O-phosphatidyltransferase [Peptococcaceae bacterium]|nr:CDP-diacylglycerol--serine O-phosphatidyltransferase [Peptococcaceae bacterium]